MYSVFRALGWKEWREQRSLVLAGLAASAMLPPLLIAGAAAMQLKLDYAALSETMLITLAALVWPSFAAAAGAGTIAGEIGEGTLGFLLSRPVSRARLWFVKVLLAGSTVGLIVAGSMGMVWAFMTVAGSQGLEELLALSLENDVASLLNPITFAGALLVLFASATFFSTFLSRALTAAAAGVGLSLWLVLVTFLLWSRLDLEVHIQPELLATQLFVAGILILGASLYLFARGEMKPDRRRSVVLLFSVVPALAFLFLPVIHAYTRLSPSSANLYVSDMSQSGDSVAVTAVRPDGMSPQIWLVQTDGTGMRRLAPRLTMEPVFSPDGAWIAYLSGRGAIGLTSGSLSLLVMRPDGSESRLLATDLPAAEGYWDAPRPAFSLDMKWVVLKDEGRLTFARLDGKETLTIDLRGTPAENAHITGWNKDGTELLLLSRYEVATVWAVHPGTRRVRSAFESEHPAAWSFWYRPAQNLTRLPLLLDGDDPGAPKKLVLADIEKRTVESIHDSVCPGTIDYLEDRGVLAYSVCTGNRDDGFQSEIRIREVAGGDERRLARFEGRAWGLQLSPAGDRVIGRTSDVRRNPEHSWVSIFGPDGRVKTFPSEWFHIGWSGRNRVVLADHATPTRVAMADADTASLITVYPGGY